MFNKLRWVLIDIYIHYNSKSSLQTTHTMIQGQIMTCFPFLKQQILDFQTERVCRRQF